MGRFAPDSTKPMTSQFDEAPGVTFCIFGTVHGGHRGHGEVAAVGTLQGMAGPGGEANGRPGQPPGAAGGGQHEAGGEGKGAATVIEVVRVIVVADQHQIHLPELFFGDRLADGLGQVAVRAGASKVGSLTMRRPPRSRTAVGPPTTMAAQFWRGSSGLVITGSPLPGPPAMTPTRS